MSPLEKLGRRVQARWQRTIRWEFWPPYIFYIPVALNYARLAMRHGGLKIPFCTNPGTINGFQAGESKAYSLGRLFQNSPEFVSRTWLIEGKSSDEKAASLLNIVKQHEITCPFILKPDCGNRGSGVKLVKSFAAAEEYLSKVAAPTILQRFAPGPLEAGVFYYRLPDEETGRLFAITKKVFPKVIGDGHSTLEELIWRDERAFITAKKFCRRFAHDLHRVIELDKEWPLVNAGNHAQGCVFHDGWHLATDALSRRIDQIAKGLDGFYFGRFDVRYQKESDLMMGRNFTILEVNGFASEATSIYDPANSVMSAYKTLFRQWDLVFRIGAQNRQRSASTPTWSSLIRRARSYRREKATHPLAD